MRVLFIMTNCLEKERAVACLHKPFGGLASLQDVMQYINEI